MKHLTLITVIAIAAIISLCAFAAHAPVTIEGGLYLRGTDNVLYRITVNAGVISATAQTE